ADLPLGDLLPHLHLDLPHRARDVRLHRSRHGGQASTAAAPERLRSTRQVATFTVSVAHTRVHPEESTMAERQETSVMVSIQEILRDAQNREEQEKVEAETRAREEEQRRLDDARQRQDEEEARLRSEDDDRQRRSHEEQRRQAEIQARQEAHVQRARSEAEAQARMAELSARQEHERQLHALGQDKHKKRLTMLLVGLGVFVVIGGIGGGVLIKRSYDESQALKLQMAGLEAQIDDEKARENRLNAEIAHTKD